MIQDFSDDDRVCDDRSNHAKLTTAGIFQHYLYRGQVCRWLIAGREKVVSSAITLTEVDVPSLSVAARYTRRIKPDAIVSY